MRVVNVLSVSDLKDLCLNEEGNENKDEDVDNDDDADFTDAGGCADDSTNVTVSTDVVDLTVCLDDAGGCADEFTDCLEILDDDDKEEGVDPDVCMFEQVTDVCEMETFGEEEVYLGSEISCWKDSGRDSQMRNARELRGERVVKMALLQKEAEAHDYERLGEDVERPSVPEEYDRRDDDREACVPFTYEQPQDAEMEAFSQILQFPTQRRPVDYRRTLMSSATGIPTWFEVSGIKLGTKLTAEQHEAVVKLLFTWKDLFASQIGEMPVTDLVEHCIPVYPYMQPRRTKDKIFTKEERDWLTINIPLLEKSGVIGRSESPWSHRTKFVRKKDGGLCMVHVFCPINQATILSSYPMKRIEPVVNNLMRSTFTTYFQADAANGFWAVPMYPPHAYRTAFSTYNDQWQYLRKGQGLAGASQTYTRLKDIFSGYIPEPNAEKCLDKCSSGSFECFVDDDFGAFPSFNSQFNFLHEHYFPRLAWAKLTLKGTKCRFFLDKISPLGFSSDGSGLRPTLDKVQAIRQYPTPTDAAEVEAFIYMMIYLPQCIPGRVEHARILKDAIKYRLLRGDEKSKSEWIRRGKPVKVVCGFEWGEKQERSFEVVKRAIIDNVVYGGDETKQYHLMTDASLHAIGGVLFQLPDTPAGTSLTVAMRKEMKIIMFISKRLLPAETRYTTTEREALAILRCLEEIRWLVLGSPFPTKVYTDHKALVSLLRKDDAHGRIVRWQIRLAEYDIEYIHIPGKENVLADGMSRMRKHEELAEGGKTSSTKFEVNLAEAERTSSWLPWLKDEWYGPVVHYKLYGDFDSYTDSDSKPLTARKRRIVRQQSKSYRLLECRTPDPPMSDKGNITGIRIAGADNSHYTTKLENRLVFVEKNGKEAFCVRAPEVEAILYQLHDCHGHFAAGVLLRTVIGRYYWPTRVKDIYLYCATCPSCQMIGPLKPSVSLMPIVHLQPLDMLGFDFVGRFPDTSRGNKYIIIGVDYFTRFLFAKAVPDAQGKSVSLSSDGNS
jgi:hypothetical protein